MYGSGVRDGDLNMTPKYSSPYYKDPTKGTSNFGKPLSGATVELRLDRMSRAWDSRFLVSRFGLGSRLGVGVYGLGSRESEDFGSGRRIPAV